jgi:hypothetical protein
MNGRLSGIRTQNGEASTSVLPFYITAGLPDDGCNYRPKHVVVTAMNKRIYNHLLCFIDRKKINFEVRYMTVKKTAL